MLRSAMKPVAKICIWWHARTKPAINPLRMHPDQMQTSSIRDLVGRRRRGRNARHNSMNSQEILSPIAAGLECKWNQLQETLDLVDNQPFLWWWSKHCSRVSVKTLRRGLKEVMDMIDGYLRDENLCNIVKDVHGVERRLHQDVGMRIIERILIPLQDSCDENDECANFQILVSEVSEIKADIQLLAEEALMREEIEVEWRKRLCGNV